MARPPSTPESLIARAQEDARNDNYDDSLMYLRRLRRLEDLPTTVLAEAALLAAENYANLLEGNRVESRDLRKYYRTELQEQLKLARLYRNQAENPRNHANRLSDVEGAAARYLQPSSGR